MKIVPSPAAARALLTSYISPTTVLIGHAIDNDLNVLRLCHPTIVDTSLLYPHHGGLPYRFPLRKLAKDFLNIEIQVAGAEGHDSMEDSRATGDLVRVKVGRWWEKLKRMGWSVEDGKWFATIGVHKREATLPEFGEAQGTVRRKREEPFSLTGAGGVGEKVGLGQLISEGGKEYRP
jgi:DNA polymerase III epsilon subunit-like protein